MVLTLYNMVFGNGNKFRIRRSASKASYLASRRERDLNLTSLPDSGSYKRTMSPCGDTIKPPPLPDVLPKPRDTTPPASPVPVVPLQVQVQIPPIQIPSIQPATSPTPQPLQLVQRAEITLRVSAPTSDAGCQTDQPEEEIREDEVEKEPSSPVRPKLQEEIECERLQQDLAEQLGHSDRLKSILAPGPEHRKPTDYVSASGLFKLEVTARRSCSTSNPPTPPATNPTINITTTLSDLERKKEELVSRLARKLTVLQGEAAAVDEERQANDVLGASVARKVGSTARPHEAAKFKLHVDEVGHITALLLALSARLARAENALMAPDNLELDQRKILEEKRDKLAAQLQEAKQLKESIDKRSNHVSNMLVQYLSAGEYADYDHFINMKAKLIMDARDIADKIKLGEEQLQALKDTLADV